MPRTEDRPRKLTIYWIHAAATAIPDWTLERVDGGGDVTGEVSAVDFFLEQLPRDRRERSRFPAVRDRIHQIAGDAAIRAPAAPGWRSSAFGGNHCQAVRPFDLEEYRAVKQLGEDRCTAKSYQTMRARIVRQLDAEPDTSVVFEPDPDD